MWSGPGDGPPEQDPGSVKEQLFAAGPGRFGTRENGPSAVISAEPARVLAPEPGSAPGLNSVLEVLAADPDDVRRFGDASRMCPRASGKFGSFGSNFWFRLLQDLIRTMRD